MRVLVTGSSGLLGSHLCDLLVRQGYKVVRFDIRYDGSDIRDAKALRAAMDGCSGVIHLAAVSRVAWGEIDPQLCNAINIDGTANVVEAALSLTNRPWLLFASSREVYGNIGDRPARESDPLEPFNAYGKSKLEGERIVEQGERRGLHTSIVRLSNVYGGLTDHPDRAVPSLLWRAISGLPLRISGADTFFDFVHVEDCAAGLLTVARMLDQGMPVATMHFTTGVATSLAQLADAAVAVARSSSTIEVMPARAFDVSGFVGNPERAFATIGWKAHIPLAEGLERLRARMLLHGGPGEPVLMPPPAQLRELRREEAVPLRRYAR